MRIDREREVRLLEAPMSDSILTLTGLAPRPGASLAAIEAAERDLGARLPDDYKAFLGESDGLEGFSGPEGDYLMLYGAKELGENHRNCVVAEFAPGFTMIGSDGGGNAFGFVLQDGRTRYVRLPYPDLPLGVDTRVVENPLPSSGGTHVQEVSQGHRDPHPLAVGWSRA